MEIKRGFNFPSGGTLEIRQGDITRVETDAIVNAANSRLVHGGGVAAVIASRGGEAIQHESNQWIEVHGPVTHEQPAFTTGGDLPCKYVIHTVGPVWGDGDEDRKLGNAIQGTLKVAEDLEVKSIAFPAISTGIFGFPKDRAAGIFLKEISAYFRGNSPARITQIKIVLFDDETLNEFLEAFDKKFEKMSK